MTTPNNNPYLAAVCAELNSFWDPFNEHLHNLADVINRLKRDGLCSAEVAQAADDTISECVLELEMVYVKTRDLHNELRIAETFTALLTREQMLLRLNEMGYPLNESYLNKVLGRSGGHAGPPIAELQGEVTLYRLDEAIAWANSHFSSAPSALVDSRAA
jgi:hypothetical protein